MKISDVIGLFTRAPTAWLCAACLALGVGLGGYSTHLVDQGRYDKLVIADAQAKTAAVRAAAAQQKAQDDLALAHAVSEAQAQEKIVVQTRTIIKEVPRYVTPHQDAVGCVTYGLVRVLDAAATGRDPADLELPAGQSDDACSSVAPSALAAGVAENYGLARQNAEQLDALSADVHLRTDVANGKVRIPDPLF